MCHHCQIVHILWNEKRMCSKQKQVEMCKSSTINFFIYLFLESCLRLRDVHQDQDPAGCEQEVFHFIQAIVLFKDSLQVGKRNSASCPAISHQAIIYYLLITAFRIMFYSLHHFMTYSFYNSSTIPQSFLQHYFYKSIQTKNK